MNFQDLNWPPSPTGNISSILHTSATHSGYPAHPLNPKCILHLLIQKQADATIHFWRKELLWIHKEESAAMTWGDLPWIAGNVPPPHHGHQVAGFLKQELCEEEQGLARGWLSQRLLACGYPLPSEGVASADCVRLPGNISSFLFLKAHNLQSDISPHDFKRHFNQQLEPTSSYTHLTNPTLLAPRHVCMQQGKRLKNSMQPL